MTLRWVLVGALATIASCNGPDVADTSQQVESRRDNYGGQRLGGGGGEGIPGEQTRQPISESPLRDLAGAAVPTSNSPQSWPVATPELVPSVGDLFQADLQSSENLVRALVVQKSSRYRADGMIVTDVSLLPREVLRGVAPATATATTLGGEVNGRRMHAYHTAQLEIGLEYLVDIRSLPDGERAIKHAWRVSGDVILADDGEYPIASVRDWTMESP